MPKPFYQGAIFNVPFPFKKNGIGHISMVHRDGSFLTGYVRNWLRLLCISEDKLHINIAMYIENMVL